MKDKNLKYIAKHGLYMLDRVYELMYQVAKK